MSKSSPLPLAGLLHLLVVYVVWGSTYLAIRLAVREGSGFPPFTLGAARLLVAGALLMAWAAWRGGGRGGLKVSGPDRGVLAGGGLLLWVGGNGLVMWAEQRADSGYAALLVASTPIWVALMEAVLDRRRPPLALVLPLLAGFAGVGLLTVPRALTGSRADALAVLALVLAPASWGAGSLLQRRRPVSLEPVVSSGYQHLIGGLGFLLAALATREPEPHPTPEAWGAWAYLVTFGSLVAFTSYLQALRLLPIRLVTTYAYVNPVIAVILGRLVLGEPVTTWTAAGFTLVLLGVLGVFRNSVARSSR